MKVRGLFFLGFASISFLMACSGDGDNKVVNDPPAPVSTANTNQENIVGYNYIDFDYSNDTHRNRLVRYPKNKTRCIGQRVAINQDQLCRNLQIGFQNNFYDVRDRKDFFDSNCGDRPWGPERVRDEFYSHENLIACSVSSRQIHLDRGLHFKTQYEVNIGYNRYGFMYGAHSYFDDENFTCHPTEATSQVLSNDILVIERGHRVVVIKRLDNSTHPKISISLYSQDGKFVAQQISVLGDRHFDQTFYNYSGTHVTCYKIPNRDDWFHTFPWIF